MKRIFTSSQVFTTVALLVGAVSAQAQVSGIRESILRPSQGNVELKPLPTLLSTVPGIASLGLGVESSAGGHVAAFGNVFLIDGNLPVRVQDTVDDKTTPVAKSLRGYAGDIGARYYSDAGDADSWYGGAKIGYGYTLGRWEYKNEAVDSVHRSLMPGVEGGYRWIWGNNVLVRLGAGADGNILQENTVTATGDDTEVTADAENTIEKYGLVSVVPRIDLGVGYAF